MKKLLTYILILIVSIGIFTPITNLAAQTETGTSIPPASGDANVNASNPPASGDANVKKYDPKYILLAPLPCEDGDKNCVYNKKTKKYELTIFDPTVTDDKGSNVALGAYLNMMFRLFLGICAVLAVIMIVMGGIEYMTTELISNKEAGKERITHAIFGLLLAFGAWTLLNTINPNLLVSDLSSLEEVTVEVTLFEKEELVSSAGTTFKSAGNPSAGVSEFISQKLKNNSLSAITVDTSSNRAYFYIGDDWKTFVSVPINVGYKGVSEIGAGVENDKKTPKGNWVISSTRIASGNNAILVSNGQYNVGAAFIDIGTGRGIGFHGSATNHLGTTAGCIRMTNDDLAALAPYMKSGVKVIVK